MSLKKQWVLTQEAFDRLLAHLDSDREQAGQKYERVRLKLVKYFAWRGSSNPDSEADETINRVARKIEEGVVIENLNAYFYGVARMVFSESLRALERERKALGVVQALESLPANDGTVEAELRECFERCLRQLPEKNRELIIEYYQDEESKKIERRKRLALRLNIPLNALRIRTHRIRVGLEGCVRECVGHDA